MDYNQIDLIEGVNEIYSLKDISLNDYFVFLQKAYSDPAFYFSLTSQPKTFWMQPQLIDPLKWVETEFLLKIYFDVEIDSHKEALEASESGRNSPRLFLLSDSIKYLVSRCFEIVDCNTPLMVIETTEEHLHPKQQLKMAKFLNFLATYKIKKLIIATYSPFIFSSFPSKEIKVIQLDDLIDWEFIYN